MLILLFFVLLAASAAISACETALFGLSRRTLQEFRRSPSIIHQRVFHLMQRPRLVLMIVLLVNTAGNVAIFAASFVVLKQWGHETPSLAAAGGVVTLLLVIAIGELLPKTFALRNAARLAPLAGGIILLLEAGLRPVLWLLNLLLTTPVVRLFTPSSAATGPVDTDELRMMVELSAREGVINSKESDMLQAVLALGHVSVREVMTPRVDVQAVEISASPHAAMRIARTARGHGLLVHDRDLDHIRGTVSTRDIFLNPRTPVRLLMKAVHYVPEQVNLRQLIRLFRAEKFHSAVVVDEYGGTAGVVTYGDIVQWLLGEPADESGGATGASTERIDDDAYVLPGDVSVRVWADRFGVREANWQIDTLAGLVLLKLGRMPRVGDAVHIRNLVLTVHRMRGRRIEQILVRRQQSAPDPVEATA